MGPRLRSTFPVFLVFTIVFVLCSFTLLKNECCLEPAPEGTTTRTTAASPSLQQSHHVTKSLSQLGQMDEVSRNFLFLNAAKNSGSEILVVMLQKMQGRNNYRHIRLKSGHEQLSKIQQEELVDKIYSKLRQEAVPLSFDQHVYFVNFTSFDKQSPTYINLIRDPVERIISRSSIKTRKGSDDFFYKCVTKKALNCNFKDGVPYDLSIPYFCGQDSRCMLLNDNWALNKAKRNVERYFGVVGVLEELNSTLEVLEYKIPKFFKGVQQVYQQNLLGVFKNNKPTKVPEKIRKALKVNLRTEYEFYEWIKRRLFAELQMLYGEHQSH